MNFLENMYKLEYKFKFLVLALILSILVFNNNDEIRKKRDDMHEEVNEEREV